jgi:hypothetical protein
VDAADADASGDEPIRTRPSGRLGHLRAYGHSVRRSQHSAAPAALAQVNGGFEIEILGERRTAAPEGAAVVDQGRADARLRWALGPWRW